MLSTLLPIKLGNVKLLLTFLETSVNKAKGTNSLKWQPHLNNRKAKP